MRERSICALPCSLSPLCHTPLGINTITWFLPIPSGDQESPEEEEDGSLLILTVLWSHEGPDGIQEAGMQLLCLIKDKQGLPAALQGLTDLPVQLGLQRGRRVRSPWDTLG